MTKKFKRTVSIMLAVLMIAGVFAALPFTASAEDGEAVAGSTKYYLVGTMNDWEVNYDYEMFRNTSAGTWEYYLKTDISANTELKVVAYDGVNKTWYPDGENNNLIINDAGNYTFYFRPYGDGEEDWYQKYIYVSFNSANTDPTASTETEATTPTEFEPTTPAETQPAKTNISKAKISGIMEKSYTGKALTQSITVKYGSKTLKNGTDYAVSYNNNKNAGTATVTIKGKGNYTGQIKKTFTIAKADNPVKVSIASKTIKFANVKKKAQTVKAITVSGVQGALACKLTSVPAALKKFVKISDKGVITISKWAKAKKDTYSLKVSITAKGNANYKSKTLNKTVKITVK